MTVVALRLDHRGRTNRPLLLLATDGDYVVVPVGAPHTIGNVSDAPVEFFSTFTPAYYVNYFSEVAELSAKGQPSPEQILAVMLRYATVPY